MRVFEPEAKGKQGMRDLVDVVVIQGWDHLFEWPIPTLHEWKVRKILL